MNNLYKWLKRPLSVFALTLFLLISQMPVGALEESVPQSNEEIVESVIDNVSIKDTQDMGDYYEFMLEYAFSIGEETWQSIRERAEIIDFVFPEIITIVNNKENAIRDTDENLKKGIYHDLNNKTFDIKDHAFSLDFSENEEVPEDFILDLTIQVSKNVEALKNINIRDFPVLKLLMKDLMISVEEKEEQVVEEEIESLTEDKENLKDENDSKEDNLERQSVDVIGMIELIVDEHPRVRIKDSNKKLINGGNPIKRNNYDQNMYVDIYSEGSNNLKISYLIKLDDDSLNLITQDNFEKGFKFNNKGLNEEKEAFRYEYEFPQFIQFNNATIGDINASDQYSNQITSSFKRIDDTEDHFKLYVEEIEQSGLEQTEFLFQNMLGHELNLYIDAEIEKGVSFEEIQESLKAGVILVDDALSIENFTFDKMPAEDLDILINYPLYEEDFMNEGIDLNEVFEVLPMSSVNHSLTVPYDGFETSNYGFELKWEGLVNSSRNLELENLSLNFIDPMITKQGEWDINTIIKLSYYNVLNSGELVKNQSYEDLELHLEELNDIHIDLENDNIVLKYEVIRNYQDKDRTIEIEGKQSARLTSKINDGKHPKASDNARTFERSIKQIGINNYPGNPMILSWTIIYNNNGFKREAGSGFDVRLIEDSFSLYKNTGQGDQFEKVSVIDLDELNRSISVEGSSLEYDGRFEIVEEDNNNIKIRIKEGVVIEEPLHINFKYEYQNMDKIKETLMSSSQVRIQGDTEIQVFNNNQYVESELTEEEIRNQTSTNILSLLHKEPLMVDYRTKEIIWGVSINTITASRIGLPALTLTDSFGEGLHFEPMSEEDSIMIFRVDLENGSSKAEIGEYNKFIYDIKEIMEDAMLTSENIPEKLDWLMWQPIYENVVHDDTYKRYNEVINRIESDSISYISSSEASTGYESYIFSEPKKDPGYVNNMPPNILNGDENEHVASNGTKDHLLKEADLRIDFVESNVIGGQETGDSRAYLILYKTRLEADEPMSSVSNAAKLTYATWQPGGSNIFDWVGGGLESSQELGEVAEYNTLPRKEGQLIIMDSEQDERKRQAIEWEVTFNYDVDEHARLEDVLMTVVDTIDKSIVNENFNLGNKNLTAQDIDSLELKAYTVQKDGKLVPSEENNVNLNLDSKNFDMIEDEDKIQYTIKTELNPHFVYKFKLYSYVDSETAEVFDENMSESSVQLSGKFTNSVSFKRMKIDGTETEAKKAEKTVSYRNKERIKKSGVRNSVNQSGQSRQEIVWSVILNDTYEDMNNLVLIDTLENEHRFSNIKSQEDIENLEDQEAELQNLKFEEFDGERYKVLDFKRDVDYSLTNLNGEKQSLDDWKNGDSGFILKIHKKITNPIKISYSSFGQAIYKDDLPLINHVDFEYMTNADETIKHKVKSEVNFDINPVNPNKNTELINVSLQLKYNDNIKTDVHELNEGINIEGESAKNAILVLYRFQDNNVNNNFVYRIGKANEKGHVEFKNIEQGTYIVKQYRTADSYIVPNSLGFVGDSMRPSGDESELINVNNLSSGKLVVIDPKNKKDFFHFMKKDEGIETIEYVIYNKSPNLEVHTKSSLFNSNGSSQEDNLGNISLSIKENAKESQILSSDDRGMINLGTIDGVGEKIDLGSYEISQTEQELQGYLHNKEKIEHELKQNKNGTIHSHSNHLIYRNYKTNVTINVFERGTDHGINDSSYTLYKIENGEAIEYVADSNQHKENNIYELTDGELILYNLDVGEYELKQVSVDDQYLMNPYPLKFFAYGPEELKTEYEGRPDMMQLKFENIKAQLNVKNKLYDEWIEGSQFEIRDDENNSLTSFTISDAVDGYSVNLKPGKYHLHQIKTENQIPQNLKTIPFEIASVEDEMNHNTKSIIFENHLGSYKIQTHTHNQETFDLLDSKLVSLDDLEMDREERLKSGSYALKEIQISKEWIYVQTNPEFTIAKTYKEPNELIETVDLYGTQATLPYVNYDGDQQNSTTPLHTSKFVLESSEIRNDEVKDFRFVNIQPGNYDFIQVKAPEGYGLNTKIIPNIQVPTVIDVEDIHIDWENHSVSSLNLEQINYYNYRGKVLLHKLSAETNEKLEGVHFDLYYENEKMEDSYVTDEQGEIRLNSLSPGNYYFEEKESVDNHVIGQSKTPFSISKENEDAYDEIHLNVSNYYVDAEFRNTDPSGNTQYTDGLFTLYYKENDHWEVVDGYNQFTANTQTHSYPMFGLKAGEYKLIQTQAPKTTVRNTYEYEFTIPDYIESQERGRIHINLDDFINYQAKIEINLVDPNGKFTHNVEVELENKKDIISDIEQNQDLLSLVNLSPGDYVVHINKADKAIVLDEKLEFNVPQEAYMDDGLLIQATARLTYAYKRFIFKDGDTGENIPNSSLEMNGETYWSDENANLLLHSMVPGDYEYKQLRSDEAYILNTLNEGKFKVHNKVSDFDPSLLSEDDFPIIDLGELELLSYRANLKVIKVDQSDKALEGVVFQINDQIKITTNQDGMAKANLLSPGKYSIEETQALNGYKPLNKSLNFIINEEHPGKPDEIVFKVSNTKIFVDALPDTPSQPVITLPSTGMSERWIPLASLSLLLGIYFIIHSKRNKNN